MAKFRLVSRWFFLSAVSVDFFRRFAQGLSGTVHFPGDFLAGELDKIFVFYAVVVTIFCILPVYLFTIIIIFLVGVN